MNNAKPLLVFGPAIVAGIVVAACSTDNGENAYGPNIGELPRRDASADGSSTTDDGSSPDPDAAPGSDAGEEASPPCTSGTIAVLAGSDAALGGAIQEKGGAWASSSITGGAAKSKPALVAFGAGFLGVTHGPGDVLQSLTFGAGWSAAATLGAAGVKGAPSLAVAGTSAHVVYAAGAGPDRFFTHGIHNGTSWNAATAPVGTPASFGTVSAGLGAVGAEVVFAENGNDEPGVGGGLYVRTFDGAWAASAAVAGVGTVGNTVPAAPEIVPVEGKFDLLLVYVEKTTRRVSFATRDATTKVWVDGNNIQMSATTDEKLSLSRVGQSTVLVTFRGQDGKGYYAQGTLGSNAVNWSTAQPIGGGAAFAVDSTPAAAKGVCGDDAVVTYASGGVIRATRLRGTSWTAPETVAGLSGSRVAIATK